MGSLPPLLAHMLHTLAIPHALLFAGPKGTGKRQIALQFAQMLLETKKAPEIHPDMYIYVPEGKTNMHPLSSIKKLAADLSLAPLESFWKVCILEDPEKCLPVASNALLKTLEEPPPHTVIILLSAHSAKILPTILSRCVQVLFHSLEPTIISSPYLILDLVAQEDKKGGYTGIENQDVDFLFETILHGYRDRFLMELDPASPYLFFPSHAEVIKKFPIISLEEVEKRVRQVRTAYDKGMKLSTCLEMLFFALDTYIDNL